MRAFAFIAAFDAVVRGTMLSVYPLLMYRAWGSAVVVSQWYFEIGIVPLLTALSVPVLARVLPRRWVFAMGVGFYLLAAVFGWAVGPVLGVCLLPIWHGAPFLIVAAAALTMLGVFWWAGVGTNRVTVAAAQASRNPLAYLGRFLAQPRLVAGWDFALMRSGGWWVFVVYLGIYAV